MYSEKNEGFSLRDIFIQLLFIILFIFILVWLFPTKASVNKKFDDIDNKLNALTSGIFNTNIQTMKDAAVSYYTTERLPEKVNDVKTMTLKEMLNKHLLVDFVDGNGNSCDTSKSYVEIVKLENEYQMKINLSCTDNDAYIIVHLGCYDYCEASGVCEKQETPTVVPNNVPTPKPTSCSFEYKLVTNGKYGDFGEWSSWSRSKVTENENRKVETKKEQVLVGTKDVVVGSKVETIEATASTTSYCPSGYTRSGDKCVKDATAYYDAKCPSGYKLSNGVCYGEKSTTTTTDPICPSGYSRTDAKCYKTSSGQVTTTPSCPSGYTLNVNTCTKTGTSQVTMTPVCPDGYTLNGNYCYKTVKSGCTITYEKGSYITTKTGISVPANSKTYYYETVSSDLVYDCTNTCAMRTVFTYKVYNTVAKETGCQTNTLQTAASCATNYVLSNGVCYKNVPTSDSVPASCPTNYTLSNGVCYKSTTTTETKDATCPSGYTLSGNRCSKTTKETITKDPSCPSGYTLKGDRCYGTVQVTADLITSVSYSCPSQGGYTLNGKQCTRTVPVYETENVYETVVFYRYSERKFISGTVDIKWSNSDNDTTLISKGYSLTGNKKCS